MGPVERAGLATDLALLIFQDLGKALFLPAAKRQGHVELWVEKLVMDFWSLKLLFIVSFGMFPSYFELL